MFSFTGAAVESIFLNYLNYVFRLNESLSEIVIKKVYEFLGKKNTMESILPATESSGSQTVFHWSLALLNIKTNQFYILKVIFLS